MSQAPLSQESRSEQVIHVELFRSFFDAHLGYQIKEIICQPLDLQKIYATFQAGLFWFSKEGQYIDGRLLRAEELSNGPFLMGGDRESANRAFGSWFSGLLLSQSPARLYFRPSEQRLLLAALRGLTDEELGDEVTSERNCRCGKPEVFVHAHLFRSADENEIISREDSEPGIPVSRIHLEFRFIK